MCRSFLNSNDTIDKPFFYVRSICADLCEVVSEISVPRASGAGIEPLAQAGIMPEVHPHLFKAPIDLRNTEIETLAGFP